ncbi:DUF5703 family protein [Arthrobacter sp. JSM 101049]|uniref:DUF5703 family protein n=1 Tax=Arthrobacter sp. JSM 101049 TaxID=929097 RepID=UPI003564F8BF
MMKNSPAPAQKYTDPAGGFEYLVLTVRPGQSIADARRELTEHAEYGKWELRTTRLYFGGVRRYWMRRRVMRVASTLDVYSS